MPGASREKTPAEQELSYAWSLIPHLLNCAWFSAGKQKSSGLHEDAIEYAKQIISHLRAFIRFINPDAKIYRTAKEIKGALIKWIVRQAPIFPENMREMAGDIQEALDKWHDQKVEVLAFSLLKEPVSKQDELFSFLDNLVKKTPRLAALNVSKHERETGEPGPKFLFTSRYDKPKAEYDFVDLDALIRNVYSDLISSD